jgi:hypothetical protein
MLKVNAKRAQIHEDTANLVAKFLKNGGRIKQCRPSKRRAFANRGFRK